MSTDHQEPKPAPAADAALPAGEPGARGAPHSQELSQIRHDLRTPINHVLGYAEMLLEEETLPAGFRGDLQRIHTGGRQLLGLINQYFGDDTFSQRPDPQLLYHELRTPVNHIVGYAELLADEAEETGLSRLIPDLDRIRDAARKWLSLCEQHLAGTQIARLASPTAVSTAGPQAAKPTAAGFDTTIETFADTGSLLVVDDDEANRQMLARRLERRGYHVSVAPDGDQALRLIFEQPFDLVLLDLVMPGIDGLEVLRRLRERLPGSELPVIMVTSKDSSQDVVESLKAGASDFVTKPVDFSAALARIRTHLTLKRSQEELKRRMAEVKRLAADLETKNVFIRQTFGRYVTDDVVESLLATPEGLALGGEKRTVTILMSDLRGFSSIAEMLPPEKVVELLNVYLGTMAEVVSQHQGVVDEFIGDAILAVFGAPVWREDHALRGVACALSMQLAMAEVNRRLEPLGIPQLEMGIGVNTGEVVVGNIGSMRRAKYGVVGSQVNLAGRIESATVGGDVLVSEATASVMRSRLKTEREFTISAKGFRGAVTVHSVVGLGEPYNLELPRHEDVYVTLRQPLPVDCALLTEAKHEAGHEFAGTLTALSERGAVLSTSTPLSASSNLRLQLPPLDHPAGHAPLYARVLGPREGSGHWMIRFTSVSSAAAEFLRKVRSSRSGGAAMDRDASNSAPAA